VSRNGTDFRAVPFGKKHRLFSNLGILAAADSGKGDKENDRRRDGVKRSIRDDYLPLDVPLPGIIHTATKCCHDGCWISRRNRKSDGKNAAHSLGESSSRDELSELFVIRSPFECHAGARRE
jgi:hypothetical protein